MNREINLWNEYFESAEDFFADLNHYITCPMGWYTDVNLGVVISVNGAPSDVERFIEQNKGIPWPAIYQGSRFGIDIKNLTPQFCFNTLVPMPQEVFEHLYEPDNDDSTISKGERWMLDNWGTDTDIYGQSKIDLRYISADRDLRNDVIYFTTRRVPSKWLEQVSKMFPNLIFEMIIMSSPDDKFTHHTIWANGEILQYLMMPFKKHKEDIN